MALGDPPIDYCGTMIPWCFSGGYCIEKVLLVPSSVIALILGIILGLKIKSLKTQFPSKFFYSISFYMFAVMMSVAGILHCFIHDEDTGGGFVKFLRFIFTLTDLSLTTNIAVTFAFAGLSDIKMWSWTSVFCKVVTIISWLTVFGLWLYTLITHSEEKMFELLYLKVVGVSGAIWFVTQIILFAFGGVPLSKKAKTYCLLTMLFASIGLIGIVPPVGAEYCKLVGKKFSSIIHPMVLWFYFSDFAILFLGLFMIVTKSGREKALAYFLPS